MHEPGEQSVGRCGGSLARCYRGGHDSLTRAPGRARLSWRRHAVAVWLGAGRCATTIGAEHSTGSCAATEETATVRIAVGPKRERGRAALAGGLLGSGGAGALACTVPAVEAATTGKAMACSVAAGRSQTGRALRHGAPRSSGSNECVHLQGEKGRGDGRSRGSGEERGKAEPCADAVVLRRVDKGAREEGAAGRNGGYYRAAWRAPSQQPQDATRPWCCGHAEEAAVQNGLWGAMSGLP